MISLQAVLLSSMVLVALLHTCCADTRTTAIKLRHNEKQAIGAKQPVVRFLAPSLKFNNELTSLLDVVGYHHEIGTQYNLETAAAIASVQPPEDKINYFVRNFVPDFKLNQEWNLVTLSTLAGGIVDFNKNNPNCKLTLVRALELLFETLPLAKKLEELTVQSSKIPSSDSAKFFKELQSEQLLSWRIRDENVMENLKFNKDPDQLSDMWKCEVLSKYIEINNKITQGHMTLYSLFVDIYGTTKNWEFLAKWRQSKEQMLGPPLKKSKGMARLLNFDNSLVSILDVLGYSHKNGAAHYNLDTAKALALVSPPQTVMERYINSVDIKLNEPWRYNTLKKLANNIVRFNQANPNSKLTCIRTLELLFETLPLAKKLQHLITKCRSNDKDLIMFFKELQLEQLVSWMIRNENIMDNLQIDKNADRLSDIWKFKVLMTYIEMYNNIKQSHVTLSSLFVERYGTAKLLKMLVKLKQTGHHANFQMIGTQIQNELLQAWHINALVSKKTFAELSAKEAVRFLMTSDSSLVTAKYVEKVDSGEIIPGKPSSWFEILGPIYGWLRVTEELDSENELEKSAHFLLEQELTRWKRAKWYETTVARELRCDDREAQEMKKFFEAYELRKFKKFFFYQPARVKI